MNQTRISSFLSIVVLGIVSLSIQVTEAQTLQNTEQNTTTIGEKNKIQQRIKLCKGLQQELDTLESQNSLQIAQQNATAIGDKNKIKQRIDICCKGQQPELSNSGSQTNVQVAQQDATAIGDKNKIKQRIALCNL